jgi:hypothetical protein
MARVVVVAVVIIVAFVATWPSERLVVAGVTVVPRLAAFALAVRVLALLGLTLRALAVHGLTLHVLLCGPYAFALALTLLLLHGTLTELSLLLSVWLQRPVDVDVAATAVVVIHAWRFGQAHGEVGARLR